MSITGPDRTWPRTDADDELRLQWEFLTFLRATALIKATGLTPAQASATPWPTSPVMSVLGVLKHLTAVERYWITRTAGGSDAPTLWSPDDVNAEWRLRPEDTPSAVITAYRAEWAIAERAIEGLTPGDHTRRDPDRTVRWVLTHVIQETARHVGHLDILREHLDGTTGE
ncbi:putative damage-inducible protein DinB [Actinokineospora baliensis]|uniref:DinB family protein n=1 Tax=Actinokineospora baliensis TaxID=547056 RepID=UPI00195C5287|nr:DinB family protein [Actinokineospora baliensis]MBM7774576.1 putative damage-inducible protein DinB [Actinokineospora baliensis]